MNVMHAHGLGELTVADHSRDLTTAPNITHHSVRLAQDWLLSFDSPNTRDAYRRDLEQFCRWLADTHPGQPIDLLAVDRPIVDRYGRWLGEVRRLRPATVARKLAQLSSLYDYAVHEKRIDHSPLAHVRRPKVSQDGVARALTVAELAALLAEARTAGDRDFALVSILAVTAVRVSEAMRLNVEDIRPEGRHRVVPVTRKGGKVDLVPLPPDTSRALDTVINGRSRGPLFLDDRGSLLDRHDAARVIHRLARVAGIRDPRSVTPHSLRATYATALLRAGVASHRVQAALGHANLKTTERYLRSADQLEDHANYTMADLIAAVREDGAP